MITRTRMDRFLDFLETPAGVGLGMFLCFPIAAVIMLGLLYLFSLPFQG